MSGLPIIEWEGDTWRVLGEGARDNQGRVLVYLASTTRYNVGRNARLPMHVTDYVPLSILNEAREKIGLETRT